MLVNLKEILMIAEKENCAIGAFNTPNLESIMAVIDTAEKFQVPVIISHAQLHENIMPLKVIGPIMLLFAKNAKVPVCVHLDHGESLSYIEQALELGFSSIMYDGSLLPYEENVSNTIKAVKLARKYNASIEAEIGIMGGREAGSNDNKKVEDLYTDPQIAKKFVNDTGIDALAASFGTAHGFYTKEPKIDFGRIEEIKKLVNIPLVMHGGSGVSPNDYLKAINYGIRKINYYSYMSRAALNGVKDLLKNKKIDFYHDILPSALEYMKLDIEKAMRVFYKL